MDRDSLSLAIRRPVGVVGIISAWNLPLYLLSFKLAPCLAMGNTAILKPSELTPRTASHLMALLREAGLPKGVVNLVHGFGSESGDALVRHPLVKAISFTGGTHTGRQVNQLAASLFKKVSLELGGKNSTVIFADADIEKAVDMALRSAFLNAGQICLAGSRILVEQSVYDQVLLKLSQKVSKLIVGHPWHSKTEIGPVCSPMHRNNILNFVELAKQEGGTSVKFHPPNGGEQLNELGLCYIRPVLVEGLSSSSNCSVKEIFGPFCTIHSFASDEECLKMVNEVEYGLAGSIWTSNLDRANYFSQKIESGILWVNCWMMRDLRTPFGGVKNSGLGREGGEFAFEFYSEWKNICYAQPRRV